VKKMAEVKMERPAPILIRWRANIKMRTIEDSEWKGYFVHYVLWPGLRAYIGHAQTLTNVGNRARGHTCTTIGRHAAEAR
jgi:hypothetical protein